MKKTVTVLALMAAAAVGSMPAQAANKKVMLPISGAMNDNDAKAKLGEEVQFFFGKNTATPKVLEKLGSDKTSQKTNAFAKSDQKVCHWAFLSAMLSLQKRARELKANAVINIVSNYDNVEYSSDTEFECHVGNVVGGVALKADFVRIADKK